VSQLTEGGATARRALRLLEALAASGPYPSLDQLAASTGLSKSTAYRLLRVLQDEHYVERAESGGYRLGSRMVGLAAAALPELDLYAAARPILRRLAQRSQETVTLHRRAGDLAILVLAAESEEFSLRRVAQIGEATPLIRGAAGTAILAQTDESDRHAIIQRNVAPSERAALETRLADVRHRGFAVSTGANHPGVHGVAIAVPSTAASARATSIAISGPGFRWTEERMEQFAPQLREVVAELSILFEQEPGRVHLRADQETTS
jgi:IclR family transcriptional regulator, acetate operon repressor